MVIRNSCEIVGAGLVEGLEGAVEAANTAVVLVDGAIKLGVVVGADRTEQPVVGQRPVEGQTRSAGFAEQPRRNAGQRELIGIDREALGAQARHPAEVAAAAAVGGRERPDVLAGEGRQEAVVEVRALAEDRGMLVVVAQIVIAQPCVHRVGPQARTPPTVVVFSPPTSRRWVWLL